MNLQTINDGIYDFLASVLGSGIGIVWDEPEAPRIEVPSIRLSFTSGPSGVGHDEIRASDTDPQAFRIVGPRTMSLSVMAYGETSFQILSDIRTSIYNPDKMSILDAIGVSILTTSGIRDITIPLETKYEKRAQMDLELLATEDFVIMPGRIERVNIESDISDIEGSISADVGGV